MAGTYYLYGILIGDGNITPIYNKKRGHRSHLIQLVTKSEEFCKSFLSTANRILGTNYASIRKRKDGYWRTYVVSNALASFYFTVDKERLVGTYPKEFIRGFYESEGGIYKNEVMMGCTEKWKIVLVNNALDCIGLMMNWCETRIYNGKTMYRLRKNTNEFKKKFLRVIRPVIKRGEKYAT